MRTLLIISILLCLFIGCEKTSIAGVDLLGKWELIGQPTKDCPSTGIIFEFKNDNIFTIHEGDLSNSYYYKLYFDNTIQIEYGTYIDRDDIITYTNDSIEIIGFTISGIPEERNTVLIRM